MLSIEDQVFGTRFDIQTGRVRGPYAPKASWWWRRIVVGKRVEGLVVLPLREGPEGELEVYCYESLYGW